jgi:hypothetical protein
LSDLPPFEMREVEHSLCEYDEYVRLLLFEGKAKRRYPGGSGPGPSAAAAQEPAGSDISRPATSDLAGRRARPTSGGGGYGGPCR